MEKDRGRRLKERMTGIAWKLADGPVAGKTTGRK
jgi:hypothetical protein